MIHSNHEVKPHRARLVLPWGTRWEARVTNVLFCFTIFFDLLFTLPILRTYLHKTLFYVSVEKPHLELKELCKLLGLKLCLFC